ncbi:MAG TPA: LuxR C-terminal-related transcriptional regulator [Ktedonobacterales bacterium]|nr:LuxR C-terminal-related transcriptional regulator [Ktedonobacterales bacterium]
MRQSSQESSESSEAQHLVTPTNSTPSDLARYDREWKRLDTLRQQGWNPHDEVIASVRNFYSLLTESSEVDPAPQASPSHLLTARQREALTLLAQGFHHSEIAAKMGISITTVRSHLYIAAERLGASRGAAAVNAARQRGLLLE